MLKRRLPADVLLQLNPEQRACYDYLVQADEMWTVGKWRQQGDLCLAVFGYVSEKYKRQVRKLIRELRVEYEFPILSSTEGYRIAENYGEVKDFCEELERKAKSATRSYFETFRSMQVNLPETDQSQFNLQ